jgi:TolA-binding protein
MLLAPVPAPAAASKEMQDLQRDVADLQEQVKQLQKALDSKMSALQALVQQALDTANRTNTNVSSMNTGVTQAVQSELRGVKDQLNGVTGLSVKVDNASNDISDLRNALAGLVTTVNKQQLMLNDILNQVKLIQTPAAAPPGADTSAGAPGVLGTPAAQPSGQMLFNNAVRDQNSGKPELALPEYTEFLRLYPNDPNAARAQYYIGEIHYNQGSLEQAVKDFDLVIEQYPADPVTTPTALYMKGMALKKAKRPSDAALSFRAVIKQFPASDEAAQSKQQLTAMGLPATPATKKRN